MLKKTEIVRRIKDLQRRLREDIYPENAKQFMRGELLAYHEVLNIGWIEKEKLGILHDK